MKNRLTDIQTRMDKQTVKKRNRQTERQTRMEKLTYIDRQKKRDTLTHTHQTLALKENQTKRKRQ